MKRSLIHPTAVIDAGAELGVDVSVGAYSIVDPNVHIGDGTTIGPHVVIEGPTRIGRDNRIYQFASLGADLQDKKYRGEESWLEIGDRNTFREFVTCNRGTDAGGGRTSIGNDNWIMAYVHIAHDCVVGNGTTFTNAASIAGHAVVEDHVVLGGFTLIHQFCRVGAYAFTAMNSVINRDVPPYVMVAGMLAEIKGLNAEGLRRHGFTPERVATIQRAYEVLFMSDTAAAEARRALEEMGQTEPDVQRLVDFIDGSTRGLIAAKARRS